MTTETVPDPFRLLVALHDAAVFVRQPRTIEVLLHPYTWRELCKARVNGTHPCGAGPDGSLFANHPVVLDHTMPEGTWHIALKGPFEMREVHR